MTVLFYPISSSNLNNAQATESPASCSSISSSASYYYSRRQPQQDFYSYITPATSVGSLSIKEEVMTPPSTMMLQSQPQSQYAPHNGQPPKYERPYPDAPHALPPLSSLIPSSPQDWAADDRHSANGRNAIQVDQHRPPPTSASVIHHQTRPRTTSLQAWNQMPPEHHPPAIPTHQPGPSTMQTQELSNAFANFTIQSAHSDASRPSLPLPVVSRTPEAQRKRARTADFVAHNTCAMVCYLTFGEYRPLATSSKQASSPLPITNMERARLQFTPSPSFVDFMHGLLTMSQVSQSVIVLSLHYIHRLMQAQKGIIVQEGGELRLAVSALMLANKFLDDNTYTNKTWSDITHIGLNELNIMEREFLGAVGHMLYVDLGTYERWLALLNGLMIAKEKEYEAYRKAVLDKERRTSWAPEWAPGTTGMSSLPASAAPAMSVAAPELVRGASIQGGRARSSSPRPVTTTTSNSPYPFTFTLPPLQQNPFVNPVPPPQPRFISNQRSSSNKRSAVEAFSPPSATQSLSMPACKRPLSLDMSFAARGELGPASAPPSHPRYETPNSLSNALNLPETIRRSSPTIPYPRAAANANGTSYVIPPPPVTLQVRSVSQDSADRRSWTGENVSSGAVTPYYVPQIQPTTLVVPYRPDNRLVSQPPEYLTFNTLAASPSVSPQAAMQAQQRLAASGSSTSGTYYYQPQNNHQKRMVVKYQPPSQYAVVPNQYQTRPQYVFSASSRQTQQQQQQNVGSIAAFNNPTTQVGGHNAINGHGHPVQPTSLPGMGVSRSARTSPDTATYGGRYQNYHHQQPTTAHQYLPSEAMNVTPNATGYSYQQPAATTFANAGPPGVHWNHHQEASIHALQQRQQQQYYDYKLQPYHYGPYHYGSHQHFGTSHELQSHQPYPYHSQQNQQSGWRQ